jgi:D-serine deaminase-like pyridoxal phosphate-dependent protein
MRSTEPDPARIYERYRRSIGRSRRDLATPALILDIESATRNLQAMERSLRDQSAKLRPHIKAGKSPQMARLHLEHGAIGVATATAWEALVMARSGIPDVLIANEVVGPAKLDAVVAAAQHARVTVAIDDPRGVAELSAVAQAAGVTLEVLIEVDVGMSRGGTRTLEQSLTLARAVGNSPGVRLRGIQAYEGHCMSETDRASRTAMAQAAMGIAEEHLTALREAGYDAGELSGGGTGTYDITGRNPLVTELQAGSFVFMDMFHARLVDQFEFALFVASTVVARHGNTVVLDAGRKSIGVDYASPRIAGIKMDARFFAEEHGSFDFPGHSPLDRGDLVELIPGYAPTTVNLHDVYHVVAGDEVVDVWPIIPRGPGRGMLA